MIADLLIDKLGGEGDGLAQHEGQPVFVPFTLPGEMVRAELTPSKDRLNGTLLEIVKASDARVPAPCKHFTRCGGCRLQHMNADFYKDWKQSKVRHLLAKAGIDHACDDIAITPPHTRRRVTFTAAKKNGTLVLGFNARASHEIINVEECPVSSDVIVAQLAPLRALLSYIMTDGQSLDVHVAAHESTVQIVFMGVSFSRGVQERITLWAAAHNIGGVYMQNAQREIAMVTETTRLALRYADFVVEPPPGGFLQASAEIEQAMLEFIAPHVKSAKKIADLFCGAGVFTLNFAKGRNVLAVDADDAALNALRAAAKTAPAVKVERRNLFHAPLRPIELQMDAVIIDPPRAGAEAQMRELAKSKVKTIISVSCNPQSFARDSAILIEGGYKLKYLKLFDQFLWSHHIEVIGIFSK